MRNVFAVVAGDLHLRPKLWQRYPSIRDDTLIAFHHLVEFAIETGAEALILPGDIFDPPTSEVMDFYQRTVDPFPGEILTLQSQHDHSDPSWISVHGIKGRDINEELVEIGGATFYGLEHRSRARVEEAMKHVPEVDFLVCHQLALPCVPYENWDLNPEWIPEHVSQALLGDLHQQAEFDLPSGGKGYYTGTMVPMRRNEIGNGCGCLVISPELEVSRNIYGEGRHFERLQVTDEGNLEMLERWAPPMEPPSTKLDPVIFVDYNPRINGIGSRVGQFKARLEQLGLICITEPSISSGEEEVEEVHAGVDLLEIVNEEIDDPQVQQLTGTLLQDCRPDTIRRFKEEHFEALVEKDNE